MYTLSTGGYYEGEDQTPEDCWQEERRNQDTAAGGKDIERFSSPRTLLTVLLRCLVYRTVSLFLEQL